MRPRFKAARGLLPSLVLLTALIGVAPSAGAQASPPGGVLIPAHPERLLPTKNADTYSLNWSGYAALPAAGHKVTAVTQNWIVPSVSLAPPGFSSTWAGIGGYNSKDLIQAGTESDTFFTPYAWYEILPASETPITSGCTGDPTCTVRPGDVMSVTIKSLGGTSWNIAMTDASHWSWSKTLNYASTFSSAEWILEAPTVVAQTVLANVGTQKFTPSSTFTLDGVTTKTIGQGSPVRVLLSAIVVNEATPSALNPAGTAFNDCAYQQTCAAPA